jgi:hypothetical protein
MSALLLIDTLAGSARELHGVFQMQMRLLLAESLDRPDAHTPGARADLHAAVRAARVEASQRFDQGWLMESAQDVRDQALQDAGLDLNETAADAIRVMIDEQVAGAIESIRNSLRMDEESVLKLHQQVRLRAGMTAATGVSPRVAFNMVKGGAISGLRLTRTDRIGKRWDGPTFTATSVRGLAVSVYCETYLMALLSNGIRTAQIVRDEATVAFDILEGYEAIADQYLHPNTTHLVSHA